MKRLWRTALWWSILVPALAWGYNYGPAVVDVPTDRLIANLNKRVAANPTDPHWHYELARAHSIAFTQHSTTISVDQANQDEPSDGYWHDDELPPTVTSPGMGAARQHLESAIHEYATALQLNPSDLSCSLGYAWCLDQAGRGKEALQRYRAVYRQAIDRETRHEHRWDPSEVCYACETSRYLLRLLDPKRDAAEIGSIRQQVAQLESYPRPITPLVVPLDSSAQFADLVNTTASVSFDLDGSGRRRGWQWITPRAGWLVYDARGSGKIPSGLRLIGSRTFWVFWTDAYDVLSALDNNGDGVLTGDELRGLAIWQDLNGDGICDPGEVRPVSDWGIVSISCHSQRHPNGFPFNPEGVTFSNGEVRATYDWIAQSVPASVEGDGR